MSISYLLLFNVVISNVLFSYLITEFNFLIILFIIIYPIKCNIVLNSLVGSNGFRGP